MNSGLELTLLVPYPLILATRTMLPEVLVRMNSLAVAWATEKLPVTLISIILRNPEAGKSVEGPLRESPAQETKPLTG